MKKEQVKKFLFQLCFVRAHKSRRFPQSLFFFSSFHPSLYFSVFALFLPHQGKASRRFAI